MPNTPRVRIGRCPQQGSLFRTRLCKYGDECQYGDRCYFAHCKDEIRPRTYSQREFSDSPTPEKYSEAYIQSHIRGSDVSGVRYSLALGLETVQRSSLVSKSLVTACGFAHAYDDADTEMLSDCSSTDSFSFTPPLVSSSCAYNMVRYMLSVYMPRDLEQLLKDSAPTCYTD